MPFTVPATFTEGRHTGEYIKSEANWSLSRDNIVIAGGAGAPMPSPIPNTTTVMAGTVLGKIALGTPVAAGGSANAGNGTLAALTLGPQAKVGSYTATFSGPTAYSVTDPEGREIGTQGANGAFSSLELAFSFAAGSKPMAAGDVVIVTIPVGSGKYVPVTADALDGSQNASAISYANVDTTQGDVAATITARETEVYGLRLTWDPSISGNPAALAAATAQLAARSIILR